MKATKWIRKKFGIKSKLQRQLKEIARECASTEEEDEKEIYFTTCAKCETDIRYKKDIYSIMCISGGKKGWDDLKLDLEVCVACGEIITDKIEEIIEQGATR
jgi:hypothetical protein